MAAGIPRFERRIARGSLGVGEGLVLREYKPAVAIIPALSGRRRSSVNKYAGSNARALYKVSPSGFDEIERSEREENSGRG